MYRVSGGFFEACYNRVRGSVRPPCLVSSSIVAEQERAVGEAILGDRRHEEGELFDTVTNKYNKEYASSRRHVQHKNSSSS